MSQIGSRGIKNALTDRLIIWHANYEEAANKIHDAIQQHNTDNKEIMITNAGPLFVAFTGAKSLGIMYFGDFKREWLE